MRKLFPQTLGEDDLNLGLRRAFCNSAETQTALTLQHHGHWQQAQTLFMSAYSNSLNEESSYSHSGNSFEIDVCRSQWLHCTRELGQWGALRTFANDMNDLELKLECEVRLARWPSVRMILNKLYKGRNTPYQTSLFRQSSRLCNMSSATKALYHIFATVATSSNSRHLIEHLFRQAYMCVLKDWRRLPKLVARSHVPLLQLCHSLQESYESARTILRFQQVQCAQDAPDMKTLLSTWRERMPNQHESMVVWNDLLTWRLHVFDLIIKKSQWENAFRAQLHDAAWTVITLARRARQKGLYSLALTKLHKLATVSKMDVQDAFEKLREQILLYFNWHTDKPGRIGGLNFVNQTNLIYFTDQQKAELFRLKGKFQASLNNPDAANMAFSRGLQTSSEYSEAWLSWGKYLDEQYEKSDGRTELGRQAMCCFLKAVNFKNVEARLAIARVLWLVSNDDDKGTIGQTFHAFFAAVPTWVWIPWIPQLLTSLTRAEAPHTYRVLHRLARRHPQALYYTLRAFWLEQRDLIRSSRSNRPSRSKPSSQHMQSPPSPNRLASPQTLLSLQHKPDGQPLLKRPKLQPQVGQHGSFHASQSLQSLQQVVPAQHSSNQQMPQLQPQSPNPQLQHQHFAAASGSDAHAAMTPVAQQPQTQSTTHWQPIPVSAIPAHLTQSPQQHLKPPGLVPYQAQESADTLTPQTQYQQTNASPVTGTPLGNNAASGSVRTPGRHSPGHNIRIMRPAPLDFSNNGLSSSPASQNTLGSPSGRGFIGLTPSPTGRSMPPLSSPSANSTSRSNMSMSNSRSYRNSSVTTPATMPMLHTMPPPPSPSRNNSRPLTPRRFAEELMHRLRSDHTSISGELERMLEEITSQFKPKPEEELESAVHALLLKAFQRTPLGHAEDVPEFLKNMLMHVCRKVCMCVWAGGMLGYVPLRALDCLHPLICAHCLCSTYCCCSYSSQQTLPKRDSATILCRPSKLHSGGTFCL